MWIQDEWNNIYDAAFVEKQWIGPLLRWEKHDKQKYYLGNNTIITQKMNGKLKSTHCVIHWQQKDMTAVSSKQNF